MPTCPPIVSLLPPGMSAIVAVESDIIGLVVVESSTVVPVSMVVDRPTLAYQVGR